MDTDSKAKVVAETLRQSLAKALNMPVFFIDTSKQTPLIVDAIRNNLPEKSRQQFKDISDNQLSGQISEFLINYQMFSKEKSGDNFSQELAQFIENLTKEKTYKAFIFVPKIMDFPPGETFGPIKIITKEEVVFEHSEGFWEHFEYIKTQYGDVDENDGLWLECTFKSVLIYYLRDELKKSIQSFLGMLSILTFGFPIDDKSLIGVVLGDKWQEFIGPDPIRKDNITSGWARFTSSRNQNVEGIKKVFAKTKNSELERKLILSSKMYWLALQSYSPEITFIALISALESLLLSGNDRDYIGLRLSEKVAFLLSDEQEKRLQIFRSMKRFYGVRSSLVHGKSGKSVAIDETDLDTVKRIFLSVFESILNLLDTHQELDDYIEKLRFK